MSKPANTTIRGAEGPRALDDLPVPAQLGRRGEDQADARQVGQLRGQAGQGDLFPARRPGLPGLAFVEPQLLLAQEEPQHLVMVAAREDVGEVEEEREHDVEGQEGHWQAPVVVCGTGRASVP
jgi:hypothetical protein